MWRRACSPVPRTARWRESSRASASVAAAEAAAVRMPVSSEASRIAAGAPVAGSNRATKPWCEGAPLSAAGKTLISLAPNVSAIAPGMTPKARPPSRSMIARSSCLVSPPDSAVIARRISGMQAP